MEAGGFCSLLGAVFFLSFAGGCAAPPPSETPTRDAATPLDRSTLPPPIDLEFTHIHPDDPTPEKYRALTNPYGYSDPKLAALGMPIYAKQCARCHGVDGHAGIPNTVDGGPPPADLNDANRLHDDPYFFWRIHDGGTLANFMTEMPAFKGILTDDDIWRVITFIRWTFIDFKKR